MNGESLRRTFNSAAFREAYHTDAPLGARVTAAGTAFSVWAPTARHVWLLLYENGHGGEPTEYIECRLGERGVWTHEDARDLHGVYYQYDVTVDGVCRRTGDPYAKACGLNGERSMVVDLARTNPEGFALDRAPARPAQNVIYELHVKELTWDARSGVSAANRGKYLGLCETGTTLDGDGAHPTGVSYIRGLGVTHVQLMPVYDYGSVDEGGAADAFNWGYDPVNYNVPDGSYASDAARGEVRIRELKAAIAGLHAQGLRVIMDVVYNHTFSLDSCLQRTVPWYYYRQTPEGKASNGSGCGNEIASERSMVSRYILDSVLYWAEEYHIDGFRFDLMGLMDVGLMNRIRRALDRRFGKGEKLLLGEPWAGGKAHPRAGARLAHKGNLRLLDAQIAAFCDATRDAVKGSVFEERSGGFVSGGAFEADWLAGCVRGWAGGGDAFPVKAASQTVTYLSCHDDWTLWDKLVATLDPKLRYDAPTPEILRANRMAAAIAFCCQGHLFLLSGEEFARTKQGIRNAYRSPVAVNRIDWARAWENGALVEYYRGLIALRRTLPGLCDLSAEASARVRRADAIKPGAAVVEIDNRGGGSPHDTLLLLVNAGDTPAEATLPQGAWRVLTRSDTGAFDQGTAQGVMAVAPISATLLGSVRA